MASLTPLSLRPLNFVAEQRTNQTNASSRLVQFYYDCVSNLAGISGILQMPSPIICKVIWRFWPRPLRILTVSLSPSLFLYSSTTIIKWELTILISISGRVAQRITRLTTNQKIAGSNPAVVEVPFGITGHTRFCDYNGKSHIIGLYTESEKASVYD